MDARLYQEIADELTGELEEHFNSEPLWVRELTSEEVEEIESGTNKKREKRFVDLIRHRCTRYDELRQILNRNLLADSCPSTGVRWESKTARHVCYTMRHELGKTLRLRVLSEIENRYPEFAAECSQQRNHEWVVNDPKDCRLNFGPFKGVRFSDLPDSYALHILRHPTHCQKLKGVMHEYLQQRLTEDNTNRKENFI
jgi:hypothetical protein